MKNKMQKSHLPLFLVELEFVARLFVNDVDPPVFILDSIQSAGAI